MRARLSSIPLTLIVLSLVIATLAAIEPAPAEATSNQQTHTAGKKKKKGLKVKVQRPATAKKLIKITVVGPKKRGKKRFHKTIRKTKVWKKARPGVYRVKAKQINLFDQTVKPVITKKKVRIKKNRKRKVAKVLYKNPVFCTDTGSRLYSWGDNAFGQLGTSGADALRPRANPWLRGVSQVSGGLYSIYALCGDGTVWAWGFGGSGALGIGKPGNRTWPVRVVGLNNVVKVVANRGSAYALKSDGSVWSWGSGRYGQLGDGKSGPGHHSATPARVRLPGPASTIAAGGYNAYAVLRSTGQVASWGSGSVGQRGNGTQGESTSTPVIASGLANVVDIAAGHATVYALTSGKDVYAWGYNNQKEIFMATASSVTTPFFLGTGAELLGASNSAGYVHLSTGDSYGWGSGRHHDTGRNTGGSPDASASLPIGSPVKALAGVGYGGYALLKNGRVWAWGDNSQGQVGTGAARTGPSATEGLLPSQIATLAGITAIGAGRYNGYAIG